MQDIVNLVEVIVKALVEKPDQVKVKAEGGKVNVVITIEAHEGDYKWIIGTKGQTINEIRSLVDKATHALTARGGPRLRIIIEVADEANARRHRGT